MKNSNIKRIHGMLGFAMRAGKLVLGTQLIERAMAKGNTKLVVISNGASDATKKRLTAKCGFYGVSVVFIDTEPESLGRLLGKTYAPVAAAVCDGGFAAEIIKAADEKDQTELTDK